MRRLAPIAAALLLLPAIPARPQRGASAAQTFTIALADGAPAGVQIAVKLSGPAGSAYDVKTPGPAAREYALDTTVKNRPAASLDAVIFAPGCETVTISVAALAGSARKAAFACKPLPPLALHGRIEDSAALGGRDYEIVVSERANWVLDFFGLQNGAIPVFRIAAVAPDDDGSFTAALPDLLHDAAARSFDLNASFDFSARETGSSRVLAALQPVDASGSPYELLPRPSYPDEILLRPLR